MYNSTEEALGAGHVADQEVGVRLRVGFMTRLWLGFG